MEKRDDAIAIAKQTIVNEQDAAVSDGLGQCYDQGAADQKAADGSSTSPSDQAQIDALTAQLAASQAQDAIDAKAASDAQAALATAQSALDAANGQIADLQTKFAADEAVIGGLKGVVTQMQAADQQLQAVVSALQGLSQPPAPAPAPSAPPAP